MHWSARLLKPGLSLLVGLFGVALPVLASSCTKDQAGALSGTLADVSRGQPLLKGRVQPLIVRVGQRCAGFFLDNTQNVFLIGVHYDCFKLNKHLISQTPKRLTVTPEAPQQGYVPQPQPIPYNVPRAGMSLPGTEGGGYLGFGVSPPTQIPNQIPNQSPNGLGRDVRGRGGLFRGLPAGEPPASMRLVDDAVVPAMALTDGVPLQPSPFDSQRASQEEAMSYCSYNKGIGVFSVLNYDEQTGETINYVGDCLIERTTNIQEEGALVANNFIVFVARFYQRTDPSKPLFIRRNQTVRVAGYMPKPGTDVIVAGYSDAQPNAKTLPPLSVAYHCRTVQSGFQQATKTTTFKLQCPSDFSFDVEGPVFALQPSFYCVDGDGHRTPGPARLLAYPQGFNHATPIADRREFNMSPLYRSAADILATLSGSGLSFITFDARDEAPADYNCNAPNRPELGPLRPTRPGAPFVREPLPRREDPSGGLDNSGELEGGAVLSPGTGATQPLPVPVVPGAGGGSFRTRYGGAYVPPRPVPNSGQPAMEPKSSPNEDLPGGYVLPGGAGP